MTIQTYYVDTSSAYEEESIRHGHHVLVYLYSKEHFDYKSDEGLQEVRLEIPFDEDEITQKALEKLDQEETSLREKFMDRLQMIDNARARLTALPAPEEEPDNG